MGGTYIVRGLIIYNPTAGRFPSKSMVERASKELQKRGWEIDIERTRGAEHTTSLAEKAGQAGYGAVFVAGGDGSINQTVAGLLGGDTALGVLPSGTANVWAQEIGLPVLSWTNWVALEKSAKILAEGQERWVDVGLCQGTPFLLWAGMGLDAFVVHHIEPRTRLEKNIAFPQYAANAAWLARKWEGMKLKIVIQDELIEGTYLLAVVTNVHLYAGGIAEISPSAKINDGQMDLWLFSGTTLAEALRHMWTLYSGQHFNSDQVKHFFCQNAELYSEKPFYLQVDGEPLPESRKAKINIQHKALKVLVPETLNPELFSEEA